MEDEDSAKAGLPRVPRAYPAMALGTAEATPLQIASAYTAFANNGMRTTPIAITRVTTGSGMTIAQPTAQKNEVVRPAVVRPESAVAVRPEPARRVLRPHLVSARRIA